MGTRRLYLLLAGLLGGAAGVLPSLAAGDSAAPSASFTAVDYSWDAGSGGHQVTIQPGQAVSFSYPSGSSQHNADFGAGPAPSVCSQSAGASSGSVPPLPHQATSPGWAGTCTFNTPGTYDFHCDLHPFMTGTIVVQAPGTTTTGNPPTPTTTTTTSTGTPTTTSTQAPPPNGAPKISIPRRQHGRRIAGSVAVPSTYTGGSLEVDVYSGRFRVGRLIRRSLGSGTVAFSVSVKLGRHRRLALGVDVLVRAPNQPTKVLLLSVLLIARAA